MYTPWASEVGAEGSGEVGETQSRLRRSGSVAEQERGRSPKGLPFDRTIPDRCGSRPVTRKEASAKG